MANFGTHGGIDLLDKSDRVKLDSEAAEKIEPLNDRIQDALSAALQTVLRRDPGGYVANKQFVVPIPNSRDGDIVFDRHYYTLNLLVDMLQAPMNEPDRAANIEHIAQHGKFATSHGFKYLPIVGGATLGEIEQALT